MKSFFIKLRTQIVKDPTGMAFLAVAAIFFGFGLGWGAYQNWLKPELSPIVFNFEPEKNTANSSSEPKIAGDKKTVGERTVLAAMKSGESCLLPESIFDDWPENTKGESVVPDEAVLLTFKETSAVTEDYYLPLDMSVICTAQAPILGRPYIRKIKGPADKRAWFQIRGAEKNLNYTMSSWDNTPVEKRKRLVEVSLHD